MVHKDELIEQKELKTLNASNIIKRIDCNLFNDDFRKL